MSDIDGPISRSEVISRAQNWVDRQVPYSQSAYTTDPEGDKTYRQDCSGYVSMCWHLDTSLTTSTLPGRATAIGFADVKAGDAVAYSGHVALAAGPVSGGNITIYQERSPGYVAQKVTNPLSLYSNAYRYNNITDDTPPTPPTPTGEIDMIMAQTAARGYFLIAGSKAIGLGSMDTVIALNAAGVPTVVFNDNDLTSLLAGLCDQELIWSETPGYAVGTPGGNYHHLGDNDEVNHQRSLNCVERHVSEQTFNDLTSN